MLNRLQGRDIESSQDERHYNAATGESMINEACSLTSHLQRPLLKRGGDHEKAAINGLDVRRHSYSELRARSTDCLHFLNSLHVLESIDLKIKPVPTHYSGQPIHLY